MVTFYPYVVSGPPGSPEIVEARRDNIIVQGNPSKDTGGAPILSESARQTQYQMEKSSTSPKLAIFTKPPMPKCEYRLSDVKEGFEYQFHVAAVNEAGTNPPRRVGNRAGKSGGQTFCPPTGQIRQRHGLTAPFPTLPHS